MTSKNKDQKWEYQKRLIAGGGATAGKGGGSGEMPTPEEDKDSLVSGADARIIDVLSEGEIEGWTHTDFPLLDVYLDGTPIQNTGDQSTLLTDGQTFSGADSRKFHTAAFTFQVFRNDSGKIKPFKSPDAGRWINEPGHTHLPWGTTIVGVTGPHDAILNTPALAAGTGITFQIGGSLNFQGFNFQFRSGTQTQTPPVGFVAVEVTKAVGTRLLAVGPNWTQLFSDATLDGCRVDVEFRQMTEQDKTTGDLHGSAVSLRILLNGSVYKEDDIIGKCTSPYIRTYKVSFAGFDPPWQVIVQRMTADSHESNIRNDTYIASYTEVTDGKLRYPNTALVALTVNAKQFNNIPTRAYHIKGVKVKIPANYYPVGGLVDGVQKPARFYDTTYVPDHPEKHPGVSAAGTWNGQFKTAWTDNPAWCWYDMCTNARYGLGHMLIEGTLDKWTLYTISQYCDQNVNDGAKGLEPRFTCNLYLQRAEDAIKVMQDMAGIFRGMVAYINGTIVPIQDSPTDSSTYKIFSPANVAGGVFSYSGVGLRARHNVAIVSWSDLNDAGNIKQEYIEDHEAITSTGGINRLEITGLGCTSRGQARRIGLWAIWAEKILTDTVSFTTALEGNFIRPGNIIEVQDPFRAGVTLYGRLMINTTATSLKLDKPITLQSGKTYYVAIQKPADGLLEVKKVTQAAGVDLTVITCQAFSFTPEVGGVFVLAVYDAPLPAGEPYLVPECFRVLAVIMKDDVNVEITALQYNKSLYGYVDFDHPLEEPPISQLPPAGGVKPPRAPLLREVIQIIKPDHTLRQDLELAWTPSLDRWLAHYRPMYRRNNANWVGRAGQFDTEVCSYRITNVLPGEYDFKVYAVNTIGALSLPLEGNKVITPPPTNVTGVARPRLFGGNHFVNGRAIFQTRDAHFIWDVTGGTNGPEFFGEGPMEAGVTESMAASFKVRIYNDDMLLLERNTQESQFIYTWDMNKDATESIYGEGVGALRIFTIKIYVVFTDNTLSTPVSLTVENPLPPAPVNVRSTVGNGYVAFQWQLPAAPDIDHYALFASLDHHADEPPQVAEFHGTSGIYYPPTTQAWFYWVGCVDTFGNISANVPQGPPPGGIVKPPRFNPNGGTYQAPVNVTITEDTIGCTLSYALVAIGANPTTWTRYTTPVHIGSSKDLWATAHRDIPPNETVMVKRTYRISNNPQPPPVPTNDNLANASVISTLTGSRVGTTVGATHETSEPSTEVSVWYKWQTPNAWDAMVHIGTDWNKIAVYTCATPDVYPVTPVAGAVYGAGPSSAKWRAVAGTTYYIRVYKNTRTSDFTLLWTLVDPAPPNNDLANAIVRTAANGTLDGTTVNATKEGAEPAGFQTVWYKYTAPFARDTQFKVNPPSQKIDVYTCATPDVYPVALVTTSYIPDTGEGWAMWTAAAGTSYYVRVSARVDTVTSAFKLTWTQVVPPPNDKWADRIDLTAIDTFQGGPLAGTTVGATRETGEPIGDNSVWYKWTGTSFWIGVWAGSDHFEIEVYTGAFGSLVLVATSENGIAWLRSSVGVSYSIRVMSAGVGEAFNFYWYTPICSTPQFDPPSGFYQLEYPQRRLAVTALTETTDAVLWWALGHDPTTADHEMRRPVMSWQFTEDDSPVDVRILATKDGWLQSDVASAQYLIENSLGPPCGKPVFSPAGGGYEFPKTVVLTCPDPTNAQIKYTKDGLIPRRNGGPGASVASGGSIVLSQPCYLKAIAYTRGRDQSPIEISRFRQSGRTASPAFTPGAGQFTTFPFEVTIFVPAKVGMKIRYTTNGDQPTETVGTLINSNQGVAFIANPGTTLRAIAYGDGYITSAVTSGLYTGKIQMPSHTPDGGFYSPFIAFSVALDIVSPIGITVNVRYTLDGSKPSRTAGTLLTAGFPVTIPISGGYRALQSIAFAAATGTGYDDSDIHTSIYDWNTP